jgi:hypothetical protein
MEQAMNHPTRSKINYTSLLMALLGLAMAYGLIPQEAQEPLTEIALIVGPTLIFTFRTWFTGGKDAGPTS